MQIVSFHPGGVLTEMAKAAGFVEEAFKWDNGKVSLSRLQLFESRYSR